jgi:hypothetical protein
MQHISFLKKIAIFIITMKDTKVYNYRGSIVFKYSAFNKKYLVTLSHILAVRAGLVYPQQKS